LRPRLIHNQVAPSKILSVQGIDGAIGIFVGVHFHKRKSARLPGKPVANQIDV
jgi:hypothetical protein